MNETTTLKQSARARLLRFLNKEHAIPETLTEYRKALQPLFEDLKAEIAMEVTPIKDILEIEAYLEELNSAIYETETDLSQEIEAAEKEEGAVTDHQRLLLRLEAMEHFDLNESSSHPNKSVELRKIERFVSDFKGEVDCSFYGNFHCLIRKRIDQRRTDALDNRLSRRFEFAFYDRMCGVSRVIKNEEELQAFEIFLLLEKYTCMNFAWEIGLNFRDYRTEVTKAYLEFLRKRLKEFRRISAAAHIELPEKDSPLQSKVTSLLAQRRQLYKKLFRELELEVREKMKHQETRVFLKDRIDCLPRTPKDKILKAWLDNKIDDSFRMQIYRDLFRSKEEFEAMLALAKDPRAWGAEEHETVLRLKEFSVMGEIPGKPFLFLKDFWAEEGMEEGFMVRF